MTITKTQYALIIATAVLAAMYLFTGSISQVKAEALSGLSGTVATTTNITVGTTVGGLAIATSTCSARIVSTSGSAVMMTMSDYANQTPTGSFGVIQAASTTVAYDGGLYGCGAVKIFSFTTQLVTVSDVR